MELLRQQLKGAEQELKEAKLQAREQKETVATVKQKYTAAIEKVHKVQGKTEVLEEDLQYSKQQVDGVSYHVACAIHSCYARNMISFLSKKHT